MSLTPFIVFLFFYLFFFFVGERGGGVDICINPKLCHGCYIGRFTVTSHGEPRVRLLRLVGKTVKLAANFVVFTL